MASAGFYPIFLFLGLHCVAAYVEPPTNVSLHCHNMHNMLKWSYGRPSPGLRFRVNIQPYSSDGKEVWVDPPALHADLSHLTDESDDYVVSVTAVMGQNESKAGQSIIFSYLKDTLADKKCFMDLPSVNVTIHKNELVRFQFTHPWLLYEGQLADEGPDSPTSREKRSHHPTPEPMGELPLFSYEVKILNQKRHQDFECVDSICEGKLVGDATQQKHCLKISGEMDGISVKATKEHCAVPLITTTPPNNHVYIYIVVALLALCALAAVLLVVYRTITNPSTSLPQPLTFGKTVKQWTMGVVHDQFFVPVVEEPKSPTPLLSTTEDLTPAEDHSTELDCRFPIGVSMEDEGMCEDEELGDDTGSGYMPGRNLEEDVTLSVGDAPSGYEKRETVIVELAPDEPVEGYRG